MSEEVFIEIGSRKIAYRLRRAGWTTAQSSPPLIVALHGGGFTSAYFDCADYSLLDRASAAGCPTIGIDRPGYGSSGALPEGDHAILRNAELLNDVIARIWREKEFESRGVVLVGHSIGSGIAIHIASRATDFPLLGIAFSGLGLAARAGAPPFWTFRRPEEWVHNPGAERMNQMFGPPGSYAPDAPEACDSASRPVWWREIVEMYTQWPAEAPEVCAKVSVSVHCRRGDHDRLWEGGQGELDRLARLFTKSPSVDAELVPDTGHCIDFHVTGRAFQEEQISFAIRCAA